MLQLLCPLSSMQVRVDRVGDPGNWVLVYSTWMTWTSVDPKVLDVSSTPVGLERTSMGLVCSLSL